MVGRLIVDQVCEGSIPFGCATRRDVGSSPTGKSGRRAATPRPSAEKNKYLPIL